MEVADTWIKLKDTGRKHDISIRCALVKSWMPRNFTNQVTALRVFRLNLAMEVLGFYWLQARVIDLSRLTMEEVKAETVITEDNAMEIPGYSGWVFLPKSYRNLGTNPMEVSYFSGRRARDTVRRVLKITGAEPSWERALLTDNPEEKINKPQITHHGITRVFEVPQGGEEAGHKAILARIRTRYLYESYLSDDRELISTGLEDYRWELLNAQSDDVRKPTDPYKQDPLSSDNSITATAVPLRKERTVIRRVEPTTRIVIRTSNTVEPKTQKVPMQERLGKRSSKTEESEPKIPEPKITEPKEKEKLSVETDDMDVDVLVESETTMFSRETEDELARHTGEILINMEEILGETVEYYKEKDKERRLNSVKVQPKPQSQLEPEKEKGGESTSSPSQDKTEPDKKGKKNKTEPETEKKTRNKKNKKVTPPSSSPEDESEDDSAASVSSESTDEEVSLEEVLKVIQVLKKEKKKRAKARKLKHQKEKASKKDRKE
jgi:hypothetical protein